MWAKMKNTKKIPQASQEIYLQFMYSFKIVLSISVPASYNSWGGRYLQRWSGLTFPIHAGLPKAGLPRTIWRWLWNISKEWDCTASKGNLYPVLGHSPIPPVQNKAPVFVPFGCALVTGHCWKELHPLCSLPSGIDLHWWHFPWPFFPPGQTLPGLSS